MLSHQEPVHPQPQLVLEAVSFAANELPVPSRPSPVVSPNSGSEGSNRSIISMDDRKRRRMVSNRESARRSRWRKKRHLEDLTDQLNRLTGENRELESQLSRVIHRCHVVRRENGRLRSECVALAARHRHLCRIMKLQQLPQSDQHTSYLVET